jgi:hypothetical protein
MVSVPSSPTPARDAIGAALLFVRSRWRLVLTAAGVFALAQTAAVLLTGPSLIWMVVVIGGFATVHALFTNAALGAADARQDLPGHAGRLTLGMGLIGLFGFIVMLMVVFVAMSFLVAPYAAEIEAVRENEAAVREITERAIAAQPDLMMWFLVLGGVLLFVLTARFFLAAPATVDRKRVLVFESWPMTRGSFLRIVAARIVLLGPALVFAGALHAIVASLLGAPADPAGQMAFIQSSRMNFAFVYGSALFFQTAVYGALEAALSANFYKLLNGRAPPPVAQGSTDSH